MLAFQDVGARFAFLVVALQLVFAGAACSSSDLGLSFQFGDQETRTHIERIMVTVAEPIVIAESAQTSKGFVSCREVGLFRPSARFDRSEKQLSGMKVYADRDFRKFPLDDEWEIDLPDLNKQSDENPWGALMILFEARGPAFSLTDDLARTQEETLLTSCTCVRRFDGVSSGNPDLDALVESECTYIGPGAEEQEPVHFGPLVSESVRLDTCRSQEYVAPNGAALRLNPGLCLSFDRCQTGRSDTGCVRCVSDEACRDLSNVPVKLSLSPGAPATLKNEFIVTRSNGSIYPELVLNNCSGGFSLLATILGRDGPALSVPIHCVDSLSFDPPLSFELSDSQDRTPSATIIPAEKIQGLVTTPPQLALLSNTSSSSMDLRLMSPESGDWQETGRHSFAGSLHFDVHGYNYRRPSSGRRSGDQPVLAMVTGLTTTVADGSQVTPQINLRLDLFSMKNGRLEHEQTTDRSCESCACEREGGASCDVCDNAFRSSSGDVISIQDTDMDGDGYADLVLGHYTLPNSNLVLNAVDGSSAFVMNVFYSSAVSSDGSDRATLYRDDIEESCTCFNMGFGLNDYTLLRWGGSARPSDLWNVDMAFGRPVGGAGQYSRGRKPQGPPCKFANSSTADCGNDRTCVDVYGNGLRGQCLQTCPDGMDSACVLSATAPYCLSAEDELGNELQYYCGGEGLSCLIPNLVWDFFFIRDVAHGQFTTSPYEDAVMVGAAERDEFVRVLYGGKHDHTTASQTPKRERKKISYDLIPSSIEGIQDPVEPRLVAIEDFNGDGIDDIAVLYGKPAGSEQVRIWLGANASGANAEAGVRGLGAVDKLVMLNQPTHQCDFPIKLMAHDMDGDGRGDLLVLCQYGMKFKVHWYRSSAY